MVFVVDFNSDEAYYLQLRNQIVMAIAGAVIKEGDSLPSVREMAGIIGINMHTVNKAYAVLKQEGYLKLDKRNGAVIAVSSDKLEALEQLRLQLRVVLAQAICKNISAEELHAVMDELLEEFSV